MLREVSKRFLLCMIGDCQMQYRFQEIGNCPKWFFWGCCLIVPTFGFSLKRGTNHFTDWSVAKLCALHSHLRLFTPNCHQDLDHRYCHHYQVSFIIFYLSIIVYMEPFVTMRGGQDYRHYVGIIMITILMVMVTEMVLFTPQFSITLSLSSSLTPESVDVQIV